ncbi:MAG TPA: dTDP-4-dehydrorhamnose 3,5-epimerase family protein [Bacillota bacterium]|nr:dTDP-4-dehydrorhamnose 3,5-epimerase family protein [Bacillota bacterium]
MELIKDVVVKQLKIIPDDRGYLMEIMRKDWPEFMQFAQSYMTACYPGIYKAWHYHKRQYDHFVCVSGMAKVVLYDTREDSLTKGKINVFHMGHLNSILLRIPPYVYHGFTAEGGQPAIIINFPTELYNYKEPDEYRLPYNDPSIPYNWEVKHG